MAAVVIGAGREHDDIHGDRARVRGTDDGGMLRIRPDGHVASRSASAPPDAGTGAAPESALRTVLDRVA